MNKNARWTRIFGLLFTLVAIGTTTPGFAREKKALVREPEATTASLNRAPGKYALGLSAMSGLTGTPTAFTGSMQIDPQSLAQAFFAIGGTSGAFQVGFAGLYKYTVADTDGTGLHVGGGLGIYNQASATGAGGSQLALSLTALGGLHIIPPQMSHLKISLDGGPSLLMTDGLTDFSALALSPLLGLSVLYQF